MAIKSTCPQMGIFHQPVPRADPDIPDASSSPRGNTATISFLQPSVDSGVCLVRNEQHRACIGTNMQAVGAYYIYILYDVYAYVYYTHTVLFRYDKKAKENCV